MGTPSDRSLDVALASDAPYAALRELAAAWRGAGVPAEEILARFEARRASAGDGAEDQLLEVMDELAGWCSADRDLS